MASVFVSVVAHLQAAWYPYKDRNLYGQGNLNSRQHRYHIYAHIDTLQQLPRQILPSDLEFQTRLLSVSVSSNHDSVAASLSFLNPKDNGSVLVPNSHTEKDIGILEPCIFSPTFRKASLSLTHGRGLLALPSTPTSAAEKSLEMIKGTGIEEGVPLFSGRIQ
ncbi:hypothetical protein EDD85DRAFT_959229 [Armillaria nabsnona]|nr:hypothetical protein EDD85DRAFT_959229 [Armillaria nabsnona]